MQADEVDLGNDPVASLAQELRTLRADAGNPSFRAMERTVDFSYSGLSKVVSGKELPSWRAVEAFVRACGGRPEDWLARWENARAAIAAGPSRTESTEWQDDGEFAAPRPSLSATFIERLRELRRIRDEPTYRDIAQRSGLPTSTVADIFNPSRRRLPPWDTVSLVLSALGVTGEGQQAWRDAWRQASAQIPQRQPGRGAAQQLQQQALDLGLEGIYPTRAEALKVFAQAIDDEIELAEEGRNLPDSDRGRVWVFGSSHKGLIQIAIGRFDGSELISRVVKAGCDLRILCTNPGNANVRAAQENRMKGEIEREIFLSLGHFKRSGVKPESVKYHKNMPNVFAICTSNHMLLNPYPYGGEAFRDFTLIVYRTPRPDGIFEKYVRKHFEAAWSSADDIPQDDWDKA